MHMYIIQQIKDITEKNTPKSISIVKWITVDF